MKQPSLFNPDIAKGELVPFCESCGLMWSDVSWDYAVPFLVRAELGHATAVALAKAHITLVGHLFNPKAYSFKSRLLLAAHFLFNFKAKPKG